VPMGHSDSRRMVVLGSSMTYCIPFQFDGDTHCGAHQKWSSQTYDRSSY
jgi:hypothetical protein